MPTVAQMYGSTIVMYMFIKWFDKKGTQVICREILCPYWKGLTKRRKEVQVQSCNAILSIRFEGSMYKVITCN